ncbi:MAG TPA: sigma 54-interacting transcriptional regulator [Thermoanaerobaculia bacterium]|nr:sigma 54-interacting transcriptional regulator [Thermoanaerobaculia bacterium]
MPAPRAARAAPLEPERHAIAACGDRWLELFGLDAETLAPAVDVWAEGETLRVRRASVAGKRLDAGRVPRSHAASVFLQGAAAAAFYASRGFALPAADLDAARWDAEGGAARLWLAATPGGGDAEASALPRVLLRLLDRVFGRGGRLPAGGARALAAALSAREAPARRPEFWVAETFRAFPELAGPAASPARQRCLGASVAALGTRSERALLEKARAIVRRRAPRVFGLEASPFAPGAALSLDAPPPKSAAEAVRRLVGGAASDAAGQGAVWIAVAPEEWDALSRLAFEAAARRLASRVDVVVLPSAAERLDGPDAWRRALWLPFGTLPALVRFYEWLAGLDPASNAEGRARGREFLASSGFARFAADPTGDAPLPLAMPLPPARREPAVPRDSEGAIGRALADGEVDRALELARRRVAEFGEAGPEAWFALSALLSARLGDRTVPWVEALEAEREVAGGRTADARTRLERLVRHPGCPPEERRRAVLRLAEVGVMLGEWGSAARLAAAWRREHPEAPAAEGARALRLGAAGLAREGRTDCALALLDEADALPGGLGAADRLELLLTRARVYALAGRFEDEDRLYALGRPPALASGDDRLAARFLAQEGRALLDRRDFGRATLRLEAALAAETDLAERAALSIDLAATRYHAEDRAGSEAALGEALTNAAAAGREDLGRIARSNRIELLLDRGAFDAADAEIAAEHEEALRARDERRRLLALHHRGRLELRRGELSEAARHNAEARALAAAVGDRLEIGELWLEEGDRCAYAGDREGARAAWEAAAADPPDRCDSARIARARLDELAAASAGLSAEALAALDAAFGDDAPRAAEAIVRAAGLCGRDRVPAGLRERAAAVLRGCGAAALADQIVDAPAASAPDAALRRLRTAVAGALEGDGAGGERALPPLGLVALAVRDADGRELVRFDTGARRGSDGPWRPLEAGAARFELALTPDIAEARAAQIALVLESLLYRSGASVASSADFAEGWRRLGLVTADLAMEEPYRRLVRFAPQPVTVLVSGESGSGKEAVARAVHRLSPRAAGPFVAVNVPAIPAALAESELFGHVRGAFTGADRDRRGLLEEASGGTLFFDEIGDLALPLQSKLLRALQEGEVRRVGENRTRAVDVRVVSATSRDLARGVEAGTFREDLFYRLHVAPVRLPPLRDRGRDVLLLARHFLERYGREYGRGPLRLAADAGGAVVRYPWPGNVRELQNAMAQAAALADGGGPIGLELLPEAVRGATPRLGPDGDYRTRVDAHRRDLIADALDRSGGNRTRAARDLGLSRQALLYLIKELKVPESRRGDKR